MIQTMPSLFVTVALFCLLLAVHLSVSQLTNEQQQLLLDLHNQARGDVAPIATNMEEMVSNVINLMIRKVRVAVNVLRS